MTDAGATWTDERVELLKKLWSEGQSASRIAAEIGGVTRNAVIGKVHRLGLSGRGKTNPTPQARPRKPASTSAPRPAAGAAPAAPAARQPAPIAPAFQQASYPVEQTPEVVDLPESQRVTIMELRESMCRWPIGDPTNADFRFCGARCIPGLPYCTHHAQIAYQPAADRRRDRRLLRA
jgi:GcrA cell cycle regulator